MTWADLGTKFPEDLVFVQDRSGMGIDAYRSLRVQISEHGTTTIYKDKFGLVHMETSYTNPHGRVVDFADWQQAWRNR